MTAPEMIQTLFPQSSREDLSKIWKKCFHPGLSALFKKPMLDILAVDECLEDRYGKYPGSLKSFIEKKFGTKVVEELRELVSVGL